MSLELLDIELWMLRILHNLLCLNCWSDIIFAKVVIFVLDLIRICKFYQYVLIIFGYLFYSMGCEL